MNANSELLRRYVEESSEGAFTELVREHLKLVYSAALREMNGDAALAEEIAQLVFIQLAREAPRLLRHPALAGWLYTSVRHQAAHVRRAERRRWRREEKVQGMNALLSEDSPEQAWQQLQPVLDDTLHELKDADRAAVVLRFLENRSLREVGLTLGLQENAARMRVDRALDKLRGLLARRGITSTASGLAAALVIGVLTPVPNALAATIASTALASSAATGSTTLALIKLMSLAKIKVSLIGVLVAAGVAVPTWQQTRLHRVQSELAQLQAQQHESAAQESELAALRSQVKRLGEVQADQAELERLRQWQAQTQPELLRLRGMAGAARRAAAEADQLRAQLQGQSAQTGTNQVPAAMAEAMKQAMEQAAEGRLARMAASLRLTPEQTQAVSEALLRYAQLERQVYSGSTNVEEFASLGKAAADKEQQIQALLTPEQKAAYQNYQQEEAARDARQAASAELLQMTASLNLTSEQEDRAYAALYDLSLNQLTGRTVTASTSQTEAMQAFLDQKAKALEPVLTPDQLEKYRQQQAAQAKFAQDIVGKMQGASGSK
jgi:RNA polymerase sigma factor (sigma-70 family)